MSINLLVTGASGFVGENALPHLTQHFNTSTISLRSNPVNDLDLNGIDSILHLAGKAHQMQEIPSDEYFKVNHRLTLALAKKAKESGVSHFVFVSTVKVYGEQNNTILDEDSICTPDDPYGESKLLAEKELLELVTDDFVVSIVRPPLVYGPKVKGNLKNLRKLINKLPVLPFGSIKNERSMVFVGNLTFLIIHILNIKPQGIFIAGDQYRHSTSDLVNTMIKCMGVQKKNITLPKPFWHIIKIIRPSIYTRLADSYIIDNSKTNKQLSFLPPYSFEEGIRQMIQD